MLWAGRAVCLSGIRPNGHKIAATHQRPPMLSLFD